MKQNFPGNAEFGSPSRTFYKTTGCGKLGGVKDGRDALGGRDLRSRSIPQSSLTVGSGKGLDMRWTKRDHWEVARGLGGD